MSAGNSPGNENCRHALLYIGAEPHALPPDVAAHVAGCPHCTRFLEDTLKLDGGVRAALELPLAKFRKPTPAPRRFALAATIVLAMVVAGGVWLARSEPALASEVVAHVTEEPGSWGLEKPLSTGEITAVLHQAGVEFDTSLPIVYASACPFHGRVVPHLVVQTRNGPMTVMLLAKEKVSSRRAFSENGYRGVLLPAGSGSVAVLMRSGEVPEDVASKIVTEVRF